MLLAACNYYFSNNNKRHTFAHISSQSFYKSYKVRLHNQGLDVIEVSDNGTGVPKSSRPFIAMKHATSKLACFEDLYRGGNCNSNNNSNSNNNYEHENGGDDDNGGDASHKTNNDKATTIDDPTYAAAPTLGFRGEALFCLANLSRSMVVSTRCNFDNHNHNHSGDDTNNIDAGDGDDNGISNSSNTSSGLGEQFAFDHEGHLIPESVQAFARPVGTTVTVNGLFETLPVRRVDLIKRIKGQRMKLMKMLQGCKLCDF